MAFVPAPNIVELEFLQTLAGQQIENRIMVDTLASVTAENVAAVAAIGHDWVTAHLIPASMAEVTFRAVRATSLETLDGPQVETPITGTPPGTFGSDSMPNEVTLAVSLKTHFRGRSSRGRWFWSCLPRAHVAGNNVDSGYSSLMASALIALSDAIVAGGFQWVIVSYISEGHPRVGGPVYFPVETITFTDLVVDSQRRRKPGVGS